MNILGKIAGFSGKTAKDFLASGSKRFPKNMAKTSNEALNGKGDLNELRAVIISYNLSLENYKLEM